MGKTLIYADHAATTALSAAAQAAMCPWLMEKYANPSTLYSLSREPRKAIEAAREVVAESIGAQPDEIFFTSGGTEADNWALTGVAFQHIPGTCRIITSAIEHHAILRTCDFLRRMGYEIDILPVDERGVVSAGTFQEHLSEDTALTSIMLANNEIGTIEPIAALADIAHSRQCLFHTDAVQAVGHIPVNVRALGTDMLSASAHKFNGPKGCGFLYVRRGVHIEPFLHGGAQERGQRAGTENVAGIVGMAAALKEHVSQLEQEMTYLRGLTEKLLHHLRERGVDFIVNGSEERIPGSLSLSLRNADGEMILHRMDLMGTALATGSACDSKDAVLSHVIRAIGVKAEYAHGTIRITLGMDNDEQQVVQIAEQLARIVKG